VSYVLNGKDDVAIPEATRQRVRDAAARLGYTPSAAARALRSGRSDLVLCVLPNWTIGPVIDTLLDHLSTELGERGLSVLVHHDRPPRPLSDLWRAVTPCVVLGLAPFADEDERAMRRAGIKIVGSVLDEEHAPGTFSAPQTEIGRLQVQHLVERGHRVLAYAAPSDPRLTAFADRRVAGVLQACAALGLPAPRIDAVALDPEAASRAVRRWREGDEPVTAVAAYNDEVALAVLSGVRAEGLRVPQDVAVIGVDDIPVARLAAPALTTVWQAVDAQARYLAAAVLAALDDSLDAPTHPGDVFHVIARDST
jgi:DNA-binding LacI/PurR family transcriptional regulator